MKLITKDSDGNRWLLWPIRVKWGAAGSSTWFKSHGWCVGSESVPTSETAFGCMPGFRDVFGQTLHFGRLKITFGKGREAEFGSVMQAAPGAR